MLLAVFWWRVDHLWLLVVRFISSFYYTAVKPDWRAQIIHTLWHSGYLQSEICSFIHKYHLTCMSYICDIYSYFALDPRITFLSKRAFFLDKSRYIKLFQKQNKVLCVCAFTCVYVCVFVYTWVRSKKRQGRHSSQVQIEVDVRNLNN
jgi:hypothetical protein